MINANLITLGILFLSFIFIWGLIATVGVVILDRIKMRRHYRAGSYRVKQKAPNGWETKE